MLWSVGPLSVLCRECRATKLLFRPFLLKTRRVGERADSLSLLLLLLPQGVELRDRLREIHGDGLDERGVALHLIPLCFWRLRECVCSSSSPRRQLERPLRLSTVNPRSRCI